MVLADPDAPECDPLQLHANRGLRTLTIVSRVPYTYWMSTALRANAAALPQLAAVVLAFNVFSAADVVAAHWGVMDEVFGTRLPQLARVALTLTPCCIVQAGWRREVQKATDRAVLRTIEVAVKRQMVRTIANTKVAFELVLDTSPCYRGMDA